mmetsp:Transcript_13744/g.21002  ORF Transcript_13744/g.21002 Transcript_13744/m.21002 type:complete len:252 (-) Transcript_13744:104-859(-)
MRHFSNSGYRVIIRLDSNHRRLSTRTLILQKLFKRWWGGNLWHYRHSTATTITLFLLPHLTNGSFRHQFLQLPLQIFILTLLLFHLPQPRGFELLHIHPISDNLHLLNDFLTLNNAHIPQIHIFGHGRLKVIVLRQHLRHKDGIPSSVYVSIIEEARIGMFVCVRVRLSDLIKFFFECVQYFVGYLVVSIDGAYVGYSNVVHSGALRAFEFGSSCIARSSACWHALYVLLKERKKFNYATTARRAQRFAAV